MTDPDSIPIVLVVARADNGVIGNEGGMPWKLSSDLKRFRKLTMGKPVIMGRKTFDAIGKPLEGRDNIVVTRNPDYKAEGILLVMDMEQALRVARDLAFARGAKEIAVIGGAQIYEQALPRAGAVELTEVHASPDGDTSLPAFESSCWREVFRETHEAGPKDSFAYSFVRLERS